MTKYVTEFLFPVHFPIRHLASHLGRERADRLSRLAQYPSTPVLAYILQNIAEGENCVALLVEIRAHFV